MAERDGSFIKSMIQKLASKANLTIEETSGLMKLFIENEFSHVQLGCIMMGLRMKGETTEELLGFLREYRDMGTRIYLPDDVEPIDMCGTGGDGPGAECFNISTTAMFVVVGARVNVAKHGTKAVSSSSGSSDVLSALGVDINLKPEKIGECFKNTGICYMHGPNLNSAMKNVIGPRKESGLRSFFNLLGPMSNPAKVKRQIIGIYSQNYTELVANTLKNIGSKHVMVFCSDDGLDELSTITRTKTTELKDGEVRTYYIDPKEYGFATPSYSDLKGGKPEENAKTSLSILVGEEKGSKEDIVVFNAAAGIMVGGKVDNLRDGIELARDSIRSGKAFRVYERFRDFNKITC